MVSGIICMRLRMQVLVIRPVQWKMQDMRCSWNQVMCSISSCIRVCRWVVSGIRIWEQVMGIQDVDLIWGTVVGSICVVVVCAQEHVVVPHVRMCKRMSSMRKYRICPFSFVKTCLTVQILVRDILSSMQIPTISNLIFLSEMGVWVYKIIPISVPQ